MTDIARKRPQFQPWQINVFGVLFLAVIVAVLLYFSNTAEYRAIQIEPSNLTDAEVASLEKAVEPLGKVQFFGADLSAIHRVVSELSWVGSANVYRDWDKGVMVSVKPRIPVANFGSEQMLDASGVVYTPADPKAVMDKSLANLYSRPKEAVNVMRQMRRINTWFAPLNLHAVDMILTPRQTWVIVFDNGLRVVVDHEDTEQKLYSLSVQLSGQLKPEVAKIASVDLRYKNGFAIAYKHR